MFLPSVNIPHLTEFKSPDKILNLMVTMTRSNHDHTMMLQTYSPKQCPYQVSASYTLRFQRYCLDKIVKVKVNMERSQDKSRSHHDVAHLQPPTNVLIKHQLPTPYSCRHKAQTRYYRSRSLWQS